MQVGLSCVESGSSPRRTAVPPAPVAHGASALAPCCHCRIIEGWGVVVRGSGVMHHTARSGQPSCSPAVCRSRCTRPDRHPRCSGACRPEEWRCLVVTTSPAEHAEQRRSGPFKCSNPSDRESIKPTSGVNRLIGTIPARRWSNFVTRLSMKWVLVASVNSPRRAPSNP